MLASVGIAYFAVVQGKESDEEKQLKDLEIQKGSSSCEGVWFVKLSDI